MGQGKGSLPQIVNARVPNCDRSAVAIEKDIPMQAFETRR